MSQILLYQSEDGRTKLDVRLENQTLWLNQKQLTELFGKAKGTISEHIKHIFEDGELEPAATVRLFRTVQIEGEREVTREVECYNLDMVLPEEDIKAFFSETHRLVDNIRCHHESMMIKRDFYTHENEVRLVAYDLDDRNRRPEMERHNLKFSPEEPNHMNIQIGSGTAGKWIDELVINPRLLDCCKQEVRDRVLKTNFDKNRIKESSLFATPEIVIRL